MTMQSFSQNDVLAYFYEQFDTLFSAGTPLADVYLEAPQVTDTDFDTTSELAVHFVSEQDLSPVDCGNKSAWVGGKRLNIKVTIISRDRYTAMSVWNKLEEFLHQGQFSTTLLTPAGQSSPLMYVDHAGARRYATNSEVYGLQIDLTIYHYRNFL